MKKILEKQLLIHIFNGKLLTVAFLSLCAIITVTSYMGYFNENAKASNKDEAKEINSESDALIDEEGKKTTLEFHSVEEDLSITFNLEDGKRATGYPFEVSIKPINAKEEAIIKTDEDKDGIIYIDKIAAGDYEIEVTMAVGYLILGKKEATVAPKAVYKKVEVAEKIVSQNEVNLSTEDGQYGVHSNDTSTTANTDTQEPENETVVNKIEEKVPLLDDNGIRVYYYIPVLDVSENKYLTLIDGTVTDLEAVLDEKGYLVSGKRAIEAEPYFENIVLIDSNYNLLKYNGNTIKAEKIAPTTTQTTTTITYYGWQVLDGKTYYYDSDGEMVTGHRDIAGIKYYFNSNGVLSSKVGIDVSYWQGVIDWAKVKEAGVDFAILRIGFMGWTSGALISDSTFARNIAGAKAAGIKVGVYFYDAAITTQEAVEEASMCLELLGGKSLDYPIFIDMEDSGSTARNKDLTTEQRTLICQAFCNTIKNSGYKAGIYSSSSYLTSRLNMSSLSNNYVWVANWGVSTPYYSGHYDLWQYSQSGVINGISGVVDMNISYLGY